MKFTWSCLPRTCTTRHRCLRRQEKVTVMTNAWRVSWGTCYWSFLNPQPWNKSLLGKRRWSSFALLVISIENVRHCCHPLRIKARRLPSTLITPGWYSTDKQGDPSFKSKRYQFLHWHQLQEWNTMPEWCMAGLQKEVDGWYLEKNSALRRCWLVWFLAHLRSVKALKDNYKRGHDILSLDLTPFEKPIPWWQWVFTFCQINYLLNLKRPWWLLPTQTSGRNCGVSIWATQPRPELN